MQQSKFFDQIVFRSALKPINLTSNIDFMKDEGLKEALYLASSTLQAESTKQNLSPRDLKKLTCSIYKYKARVTNRPTPYGLFAGIGTAEWGNENKIIFRENYSRNTRLDMNILCSISDYISKKKDYIPFLTYYPNRSIYQIADQVRYVEYYYKNNQRQHQISSIENNPYLQKLLAGCSDGASVRKLVNLLVEDEIDDEEALLYANQLIEAQVLVSEIEPTLTGTDFADRLIEQVEKINSQTNTEELRNILDFLKETKKELINLDKKIGNDLAGYATIISKLKILGVPFDEKNVFQVDLSFNPAISRISTSIQKDILNTLSNLQKLFPASANTNLNNFKTKFFAKYENQKVPFLQVLDKELGLGYPLTDSNGINPLIEDLFIQKENGTDQLTWSKSQEFLFKKLLQMQEKGEVLMKISSDEINKINPNPGAGFCDTISVMFNVIDSNKGKIYFQYAGGASASSLIGRFGHVNKEINELLNQISLQEEMSNKNKILAEIIHLPESRTGNVLFRPAFRKYEIPYLAQASVSIDHQVLLSNLSIILKENRIIIWDEKNNKEILPRLGNAHNFSYNSLPVYQFLCDLQHQDKRRSISFNWGALSGLFSFLPRVEIDDVVVHSATWQLKKEAFSHLLPLEGFDLHNNIQKFVDINKLPDKVLFSEGDNELLIDFKNTESILTFLDVIKNKSKITLKEHILDTSCNIAVDEEKNPYAVECIALICPEKSSGNDRQETISTVKSTIIEREFSPGSSWIFYKIFTGVKTSDSILSDKLLFTAQSFVKQGLCDKWFFVRYNDPENHIRIRFHSANEQNIAKIFNVMHKVLADLKEKQSISNFVLDTYVRELERYGHENICNSEDIFYQDSICVAGFLDLINGREGHILRWQWALKSIDSFLEDFGLNMTQKHALLGVLKTSLGKEFGMNKNLKIQLDAKFRNIRSDIKKILDKDLSYYQEYDQLFDLIRVRSESIKSTVADILDLHKSGRLSVSLNQLIADYLHMTLNRVFMGNQRLNEFVSYDMLYRYFESKIAQNKRNRSNQPHELPAL